MEKVFKEGLKTPAPGFGTWQLNGDGARKAVQNALDIGYRHIDTAQMYENEEAVGLGIRQAHVNRNDVFLTDKILPGNLHPKKVRETFHDSLQKLGLNHTDLLLIHWPSTAGVPLEDTLEAFMRLVEEGKTRFIGVSNFPSALLEQAIDLAPVVANQVEYHPFLSQKTVIKKLEENNMMLTAYCPLAKGKVLEHETIKKISEHHGKNPAQVTLRWHIQQDNVVPIPRSSNPKHRESNFDVFDFELTGEEMQAIHELARGERIIDPAQGPEWD